MSTLQTAIPAPASAVPTQSQGSPGRDRTTTPAASTDSARNTVRSMPNRRTGPDTTGETAANASSGRALSRPRTVLLRPVSVPMSSSTGPTAVSGVRMQTAATSTAAVPPPAQIPARRAPTIRTADAPIPRA